MGGSSKRATPSTTLSESERRAVRASKSTGAWSSAKERRPQAQCLQQRQPLEQRQALGRGATILGGRLDGELAHGQRRQGRQQHRQELSVPPQLEEDRPQRREAAQWGQQGHGGPLLQRQPHGLQANEKRAEPSTAVK